MERLLTVVVMVGAVLPLFVVGGWLVGARLGCTADTVGGQAGVENDPCRDAGPAMLAGAAGGAVAWGATDAVGLALGARGRERDASPGLRRRWRVSRTSGDDGESPGRRRSGAAGARDPGGQAAEVSPVASPKTRG